MRITVSEWKSWMHWKDQEMKKKHHWMHWHSGGVTTFFPPIERTTLDEYVTLLPHEITSYNQYLKYIEEARKRIKKLKAKHKRQLWKLLRRSKDS